MATHLSNTMTIPTLARIAAQAERDLEAKKAEERRRLVKYLAISGTVRRKS